MGESKTASRGVYLYVALVYGLPIHQHEKPKPNPRQASTHSPTVHPNDLVKTPLAAFPLASSGTQSALTASLNTR